jgi:hypothetical protein
MWLDPWVPSAAELMFCGKEPQEAPELRAATAQALQKQTKNKKVCGDADVFEQRRNMAM